MDNMSQQQRKGSKQGKAQGKGNLQQGNTIRKAQPNKKIDATDSAQQPSVEQLSAQMLDNFQTEGSRTNATSMPQPDATPLRTLGESMAHMDAPAHKQYFQVMKAKASGVAEEVKVYYIHVRDGIVEIIGSVGGRIVSIKAKVSEVGEAQLEKLKQIPTAAWTTVTGYTEQARGTLKAKTVWLQDGYIYITAAVEGQVVYIQAKSSEIRDLAQAKTLQTYTSTVEVIDHYTAPARSKAVSLYNASREGAHHAAHAVLQPFKPYFVKVENGVTHVVAIVGDKVVIIQTKFSEAGDKIQVRIHESWAATWPVIEGYTSPLMNRVVSLKNGVTHHVETVQVSIRDGVLHVKGAVGERVICVRVKVSEILGAIYMKAYSGVEATKKAVLDLTQQIVEFVALSYGKTCDSVKFLYSNTKDGFLHIAYQVNDKLVVFRIKTSEVLEYVLAKPLEICNITGAALASTYSGAKSRVLLAAESTKAKTIKVGANVRIIVSDPKAQVTAASAAGGAVAMGASGGAAGFLTGGVVGAVFAVPAAFFTFGLSIPVGAAVGAGAGLCVGTATGGAAGLVTGGAAGYSAHKHKDEIGNGVTGALSKAKALKSKAAASPNMLLARVMASTGGTAVA